jgi:CheY-like chemotaxis protein
MYVQQFDYGIEAGAMERATDPILIIGHDLMTFGLAALLRSRGQRVIVRGGTREDVAALVLPHSPAAIIVDLMVACRDDFALLRRLRAAPTLTTTPILVLSPGTVGQDGGALERQLHAFAAQPMLSPHDLDAVLGELARSHASVA